MNTSAPDIAALLFFALALYYSRQNFSYSAATSSLWDFVVLINGFGIFWSAALFLGLLHVAEIFYFGIIILIISLGLLSSQENLKPI